MPLTESPIFSYDITVPDTMPSVEYLNLRLRYDSGLLFWKPVPEIDGTTRSFNRKHANKVIDSIDGKGYLRVSLNNKRFIIHRIIWKMLTGTEPPEMIDHIDGDRTNNHINNLRLATRNQDRKSVV